MRVVYNEAAVCVEYETKRVDICCRVNADEPGKESSAAEYLWAHLSSLIIVAEQFLRTWPGLYYKVRIDILEWPLSISLISVKNTAEHNFAFAVCIVRGCVWVL